MHSSYDLMEYYIDDELGAVAFPQRLGLEPPPKQRKTNSNNASAMNRASSAFILNFGNYVNSPADNNFHSTMNPMFLKHEEEVCAVSELLVRNKGGSNASSNKASRRVIKPQVAAVPYDHITAERKRREHLSQLFVSLTAIVPGLKKMDKTSVLGDAITYLKKLQERVKTLEEKTAKKTIESVALVKKHQIMAEDFYNEKPLPEIEAKVCNKTILFNILCERKKGLIVKLLGDVEKLNLVVVNTSVASFGSEVFHVTIIAEMEKDFNYVVKDVVTAIRSSLQQAIAVP